MGQDRGQPSARVLRAAPYVSKSGCNPAYIGIGTLHVHAPHLFLGYAVPPCPNCGWKSVDNDTIKIKGVCPVPCAPPRRRLRDRDGRLGRRVADAVHRVQGMLHACDET